MIRLEDIAQKDRISKSTGSRILSGSQTTIIIAVLCLVAFHAALFADGAAAKGLILSFSGSISDDAQRPEESQGGQTGFFAEKPDIEVNIDGLRDKSCLFSGHSGPERTGKLISPAFVIERPYLNFKIAGGRGRPNELGVELSIDGRMVRSSSATEYYSGVLEWRTWDVAEFIGHTAQIHLNDMSEARFIIVDHFAQSNDPKTIPANAVMFYQETFRPWYHFTAGFGWLNDPNGLVYYNGTWHLFYQYVDTESNGKHWGHAVSQDLVHWEHRPVAVRATDVYHIFSGTGVVDFDNVSGLKQTEHPPILLFYTLRPKRMPPTPITGDIPPDTRKAVQAFSYSIDGGTTWVPYADNPVLETTSGDYFDRDPAVFHEPTTNTWFMVVYHSRNNSGPRQEQAYAFYRSEDLLKWEFVQEIHCGFSGECADMYQLAVDGYPNNKKWVLEDGSGNYMICEFDGTKFRPQSDWIRSNWGHSYYATQTFSNAPDGRIIQLGWMNTHKPNWPNSYPGMPFNQQMSVPRELTLKSAPDGLRVYRNPIPELDVLRQLQHRDENRPIKAGGMLKDGLGGAHLDIEMTIEVGNAKKILFNIRRQEIEYDAAAKQLKAFGRAVLLESIDGLLSFRFLVDTTSIEIFCNHGRVDLSGVFFEAPENNENYLTAEGGDVLICNLNVYQMKSIRPDRVPAGVALKMQTFGYEEFATEYAGVIRKQDR